MTLTKDSLEWAINFVKQHSDGDLFPKLLEIDAILEQKEEFIDLIAGKPLNQFEPKPCRRFIVPKDDISYRQATQLHPQDSIILSATVYQFGQGIEKRRLSQTQIFSYRFSPSQEEGLYSTKNSWNNFWNAAQIRSHSASVVLYCDIADFYNQIYHHSLENQLIESGFPNQATKWIIALLESTTAGVSRGVPIGPHAIHLMAESTLIPIDNSLKSHGLYFLRYADDIIVFCDSKKESKAALHNIASVLDKQQRLMLQKHKIKFYTSNEFQSLCEKMIEDRPIDQNEENLLRIIRKYTDGEPYQTISYDEIEPEDWSQFSEDIIEDIINEYLGEDEIDYIRLRWFYRRLTQVGHPGALNISIENIDRLGPCLANICTYIASIKSIPKDKWESVGSKLIALLDTEEISSNEFFRLSIMSLFTKNKYINHFELLAQKFQSSDSFARREILLAAYQNDAVDWLREHKESYQLMDLWQKMAFLYCVSKFPPDEKKYFINRFKYDSPYDSILAKWSKNK
jgi:retron-type reverse transcriptase